ncbi:MAG TPA: prolyl oligopeptidase family serine peptidase [Candidatus Binataceae bacterium]|nr:prolyl oligopeptidase family serine peptidase [Candidatus Binataceae bacterium]
MLSSRPQDEDSVCAPPRVASMRLTSRVWGRVAIPAVLALTLAACHLGGPSIVSPQRNIEAFSFQVALGPQQFQIEGYLARSAEPGRLPGMLVLNGGQTDAQRCIETSQGLVAMGIHVACVSIPGYGRSSGPSRFVGPQAVATARRALDLLAARPDVDPSRIAVWGLGDGAMAAGLLMDYDARPRALILQSGAYDTLSLWPQAPLGTKLAILRQVWPSKRVLSERSVIRHLPARIDCSVLILHGERDRSMPVSQAVRLASALRKRGARVEAFYFPQAPHDLGRRVEPELRAFLRQNLLASMGRATAS